MFEKEFQEWFERNKKWLYSSDHMQAAYHAWCAGVQQQNAAQPTLAPDACPVCRGKKGYRDAFDEWYPCRACNGTGSAGKA